MANKKAKKIKQEELIPMELPAERDFDAERKDAEVMAEPEQPAVDVQIPPADADKLWHHIAPKKILAADTEILIRAQSLFHAMGGYGVSEALYQKLPKDIKSLFNDVLINNEAWKPTENI